MLHQLLRAPPGGGPTPPGHLGRRVKDVQAFRVEPLVLLITWEQRHTEASAGRYWRGHKAPSESAPRTLARVLPGELPPASATAMRLLRTLGSFDCSRIPYKRSRAGRSAPVSLFRDAVSGAFHMVVCLRTSPLLSSRSAPLWEHGVASFLWALAGFHFLFIFYIYFF